jgi:tRNA(Ile)-lysidine synthase
MILRTVRGTISQYEMLEDGESVVAAVSGGSDSVGLLHALVQLDRGYKITVAHLNHLIRGPEAEEDHEFVKDLAARLELRFHSRSEDVGSFASSSGVSLEEAGRIKRYEFLFDVASDVGASKIATGHTFDDQAETVLMRIVCGSGPHGLSGVRPVRDDGVVRPLIMCRRQDIQDYLRSIDETYREDPSNELTSVDRNRVRSRLLPLLERGYNPTIRHRLFDLATMMNEIEEHISRVADRALEDVTVESGPDKIVLDSDKLQTYDSAIVRYISWRCSRQLSSIPRQIGFGSTEEILSLIQRSQSGRSIDLPGGLVVGREQGRLLFTSRAETEDIFEALEVPGSKRLDQFGIEIACKVSENRPSCEVADPMIECFDLDQLRLPLVARTRQEGDRMIPFGMDGSKKLQDLMVDLKVPTSERKFTPVICDRDEIIWVVGLRRSNKAPVTNSTTRLLQISARKVGAT